MTEVVEIAAAGAEAGCHEALFTLGEKPEARYPEAAKWLADNGYSSTVDYLVSACRLVQEKTGLLPHANAGALSASELRKLRSVSVSQGMMIETLRPDLDCHLRAPDKSPERRLQTMDEAGKLAIPFTTGILVGIGERELDRLDALSAIAASATKYGHIQEVIVQNFVPKPGTAMFRTAGPTDDEFQRAIALARIVLPSTVHVQAPPNLTDDIASLIRSGVDDLGGVSPVTIDHINPERPWPNIVELGHSVRDSTKELAPRLTIYPEYAVDANRWVDERLRFAVLDHSDSDWLARDDPGPFVPYVGAPASPEPPGGVDSNLEAPLDAPAATTWYSGLGGSPSHIVAPLQLPPSAQIAEVLQASQRGERLEAHELTVLFGARGADVAHVAAEANRLRQISVGDTITFVANRNINYTNVCTFKCRFCGFSKGPLSLNLRGTPYLLTLDDIVGRVRQAAELGATEVCLQGGIHPDFDGGYYIDVCRAVHEAAPEIHIHGFTALEVSEGARRSSMSVEAYLLELKAAGLRSLPGTAAEVLDDDVRALLCPDKISSAEWLATHELAHGIGLRSNITLMFGAIESPATWVTHLLRTRDLQARTGGFTEFVGLPFVHMAAPLYLQRKARRGPTFRETLLVHAIARIAYHGLIDNIQASWVKVGLNTIGQLLEAGCNDLGGTLLNENISRAAGANHGQAATEEDFKLIADDLGRPLQQRTTLYTWSEPAEGLRF